MRFVGIIFINESLNGSWEFDGTVSCIIVVIGTIFTNAISMKL